MVYYEFKLDTSFVGGYRGYVAIVSEVYFKLGMSFVRGCSGYVAVVSAVNPL